MPFGFFEWAFLDDVLFFLFLDLAVGSEGSPLSSLSSNISNSLDFSSPPLGFAASDDEFSQRLVDDDASLDKEATGTNINDGILIEKEFMVHQHAL